MRVKFIDVNPKYVVTDCGRVFNAKRGNELKPFYNPKRYHMIRLGKKDTYSLHQLVARAFVYNPFPEEFNQVNHIDGNKVNNNYTNLEWTNNSGNIRHAYDTGLIVARCGEQNNNNKITEDMAHKACQMFVEGYSPPDVARFYGDANLRHLFYRIKSRENWTYISNLYNF